MNAALKRLIINCEETDPVLVAVRLPPCSASPDVSFMVFHSCAVPSPVCSGYPCCSQYVNRRGERCWSPETATLLLYGCALTLLCPCTDLCPYSHCSPIPHLKKMQPRSITLFSVMFQNVYIMLSFAVPTVVSFLISKTFSCFMCTFFPVGFFLHLPVPELPNPNSFVTSFAVHQSRSCRPASVYLSNLKNSGWILGKTSQKEQ